MRRRSDLDRNSVIPPGLPDHLRYPEVLLDPTYDRGNRRLEALAAFRVYARDLHAWVSVNAPRYEASSVEEALGTSFRDFRRLADGVSP